MSGTSRIRYLPLTKEHQAATARALAEVTRRRADLGGPGRGDFADIDLPGAAGSTLRPYLESGDRAAFVAVDDEGEAHAYLGGTFVELSPVDEGYTYLPPVHALVPASAWGAGDEEAAVRHLPQLFALLREEASARGIERVGVQVLDADWFSGGLWRSIGLRPDTRFALRPTAIAPRPVPSPVQIRPAGAADLPTIVDLFAEEQIYHAVHTGSGMSENQDLRTVTRLASAWLDHGAEESIERAFVACNTQGVVVGVTTVHVLTMPPDSVGQFFLPPRHGYIGLTDVAADARGLGVGAALAARALQWVRDLPDPPLAVGLHYVDDNLLSAPFWSAQGYASALTLLTTAPRFRRCS